MKKNVFFIMILTVNLFIGLTFLSADSVVVDNNFAYGANITESYGNWEIKRGRLVQTDIKNPLAKINIKAEQNGNVMYEFNVRYESGGIEDLMGGFGIQIFIDKAFNGKSWGNGESYLLWINYDEKPTYGGPGFRGQVYKSYSNSRMYLMSGYEIELNESFLNEKYMNYIVPVKFVVNGNTGDVKIYDPTIDKWLYFNLGSRRNKGNYISFRTNSLSVSIDNLKVTNVNSF